MLINFCYKRFFHQYFTRKDAKEKTKAAKGGKRKGDEDEDDQKDDEEADWAGKTDSDDAGDIVAELDDGDDDSDSDEAEIWEVTYFSKVFYWEVFWLSNTV